ncbi:MAG: sigma-54 dependent transcriptional regulator [Bacteroidota bacterium]
MMKSILHNRDHDLTATLGNNSVVVNSKRLLKKNAGLKDETSRQKESGGRKNRSVNNFFVGSSKQMLILKEQIKTVAQIDTTTLILGETGTGKELVAEAIYRYYGSPDSPMIRVNCTTLSPQLFESELFGHEKGSFTGADRRVIGKFELANNGIIFLDEIGDLPFDLQSKLLRVIQEKELTRLGSSEIIKLNVKIVAATNRNLPQEVAEGRFREDLYYRLSVISLVLPPLRERSEDIPILSEYFLRMYEKKLGRQDMSLSARSMKKLISHDWPGNVRQLQHVIEKEMILSKDNVIDISLNPKGDFTKEKKMENAELKTLVEMEKFYIKKALRKTKGRIRGKDGAAEILAINPSTLESRIRKLGINKKDISI